MRKKVEDVELEEEIINLLGYENRSMSISEIKKKLEEKGIKRSPQVILRYLVKLKRTKKIMEKNARSKKI